MTDLFWALRGAGAGNFGVVTVFAFSTTPGARRRQLPRCRGRYVAGRRVIEAWQEWAPRGPDELAASLKITATGDIDQPPSVDIYAAVLATASDAAELLDQLVSPRVIEPRRGVRSAHVLPADPAILGAARRS